jgi:hypothetical protein
MFQFSIPYSKWSRVTFQASKRAPASGVTYPGKRHAHCAVRVSSDMMLVFGGTARSALNDSWSLFLGRSFDYDRGSAVAAPADVAVQSKAGQDTLGEFITHAAAEVCIFFVLAQVYRRIAVLVLFDLNFLVSNAIFVLNSMFCTCVFVV